MFSQSRIMAHFNVDAETADKISDILDCTSLDAVGVLWPGLNEWLKPFYHTPRTYMAKLAAINELIGGYGVEGACHPHDYSEGAGMSYINTGDTYTATLIYFDSRWRLSDVGTFFETHPEFTGE